MMNRRGNQCSVYLDTEVSKITFPIFIELRLMFMQPETPDI